jgi:hypothetical protein
VKSARHDEDRPAAFLLPVPFLLVEDRRCHAVFPRGRAVAREIAGSVIQARHCAPGGDLIDELVGRP